jgi:Uncharacterized protein conserved in bacteria
VKIPESDIYNKVLESGGDEPGIEVCIQSHDAELVELANAKMPFGKYAGRYLVDLPETYVLWFKGQGYPAGRLGEQLEAIGEIQMNGLEYLLRPLIRR